jgi:hypothetical protein
VAAIVITSIEEARALPTRGLALFSGRDDVVVAIAAIPANDRKRWNTSLSFWQNVCGCQAGAICALAAIAYCLAAPPVASAALWTRVAASVGIVLGSAIAGKLLALAVARAMLAYHVVRLVRSASLPALEG